MKLLNEKKKTWDMNIPTHDTNVPVEHRDTIECQHGIFVVCYCSLS